MKMRFNTDWQFSADGTTWKNVTLPHDAMLEGKRSKETGGSASGYYPGVRCTYKKILTLSKEDTSKHIWLEFGGVYKNAEVFVNEKKAGGHAYGYLPFQVNMDGFLKEGENLIVVKADNSLQPDSRWYSGAGIYRSVYLHINEQAYIEWNGIHIDTKDYRTGLIHVSVKHHGGDEVNIEILDHGKPVVSQKGDDVDLVIPDAKLWSAETPYLYTAEVTLLEKGIVKDKETVSFGVRSLSWNHNGFYVNGKSVLLKGGCIHADNGVIGAREFQKSKDRQISILKANGYNAIRSAHNPCSYELLKACDEVGMYVMDETWDMWYRKKNRYDYANEFFDHYIDDLKEMVEKDYNHPSVIFYSIGNEVSEPAEKKGIEIEKKMKDLLHELDPYRAVTGGFNLMIIANSAKGKNTYKEDGGQNTNAEAMNGMNSTMYNMITSIVGTGMDNAANSAKADQAVTPALNELDICGYNYAAGRYKRDQKLHPDRLIFGSETFPSAIGRNWKMVQDLPNVIGDFMWTAWDYLGEAGLGSWSYEMDARGFDKPYPWLLADAGAFDINGFPNGEALWAKAVYADDGKPYLAVRPCNHPHERLIKAVWRGTNAIPSWNWQGCNGNKTIAEVYTTAAYAELYLNGKKLGHKKTKEGRACFRIQYEPGELIAKAFDASGKVLGTDTLKSASDQSVLSLHLETKHPKQGDIFYVDVTMRHGDGSVESNHDQEVTLHVEGAELIGFGSANPRTEETFVSGKYRTWYGRALAVYRLIAEKAVITAVSDNKQTILNVNAEEGGTL